MAIIAAFEKGGENSVLDDRDVFVKNVVQAGHGNRFARCAGVKNAVKQGLFVRLQSRPIATIFLQNEAVVLRFVKPHDVLLGVLLDDDVAADGKIDDGGGDVAHVGGVVNKCADFAGSELL